jgi:RNA-splicing ligase RtcB
VEVLASRAPVESLSITQLTTTAHTLPGIVHAVGQPDLHLGTKFPIGSVFASKKWIHPPLIGGDIGCGMAWYKTTLSRSQVDGDKGKKVAEKLRGLEGSWRTQAYREIWLQDVQGHSYSTGEQWDGALGTIGAGNHFAEIQVVEESSLATTENGLQQNDIILIVHSGSRGYGGSVLKKFTTETRTSFEEGSADAIDYMKEHDKACEWAKANRDLIALRFLACLEPGNENWSLGSSNADDFGEGSTKMIELARKALQQRKVVDFWHNNVERVPWPPSAPSPTPKDAKSASSLTEATDKLTLSDSAAQEYAYIHRKGAAPTYDP